MTSGKILNYPDNVKFAPSHEWVRFDGGMAIVGISDYAQDSLGDVVFVELPAVGAEFKKGDAFGVVESVKAASDVYAPIGGTIAEINEGLNHSPEIVNKDAFGEGWMVKLHPANPEEAAQLLDSAAYRSKIESGELH